MSTMEAEVEVDGGLVSYEEIEKLQELGVNAVDIKRMKENGFHTVQSLFMYRKTRLYEIKGMSEAKVDKILEAGRKLISMDFLTGTAVLEKRRQLVKITTGSSQLDALLGGGIETASITEAFGEFRTGKTQLAHTLCVTAQLPTEMNGGNGKVIYIDTEGTFRPDRLIQIADRFEVDGAAVLDNVIVARAYNTDHQQELLTLAAGKMMEEKFSLIVVDSCTALFRVDFVGRGQLSDRQQKLGQFLSALIKLAEQFSVAVYLTNQVQSDPSGAMTFVADAKKPIGGNIMAHACTTRLMLKKGRGEQRICKIYDSPCLPEAECVFQLDERGVIDAKD